MEERKTMGSNDIIEAYKNGRRDFSNLRLIGTDLRNLNLSGTIWKNCELVFVGFSDSNMTDAEFSDSKIEYCGFIRSKLKETKFINCYIYCGLFIDTNFEKTEFPSCEIRAAVLFGSNFGSADFSKSKSFQRFISWSEVDANTFDNLLKEAQNAISFWAPHMNPARLMFIKSRFESTQQQFAGIQQKVYELTKRGMSTEAAYKQITFEVGKFLNTIYSENIESDYTSKREYGPKGEKGSGVRYR